MGTLQLFKTKDSVVELEAYQATLEKTLQDLVEKNMETFFGVTFLQSEYVIANGRMDSIGIDENNCPVIFEYKQTEHRFGGVLFLRSQIGIYRSV